MTKSTCRDTFVIHKKKLQNDYYSLVLGPLRKINHCQPGHFIHLQVPHTDVMFRRAFSIASIFPEQNALEIIFKVVGRMTRQMSTLKTGDTVNILYPLGKSFTLPRKSETSIMVAGGVGFPPLMFLTEHMMKRGYDPKTIHFFYGGRTSADILCRSRLKRTGVLFHPVTEDGSFGRQGLVTEPIEEFIKFRKKDKLRLYACGPEGMLKAANNLGLQYHIPGQLSLEAPMPCGIGVCLGCVVPLTAGGYARVCAEGPVFEVGEVVL